MQSKIKCHPEERLQPRTRSGGRGIFFILITITVFNSYLLCYELFLLQTQSSHVGWILNALKKVHFEKVDRSVFMAEDLLRPLSVAERQEVLQSLKVNINEASLEELVGLPRIGPAIAQRIIESREVVGPFSSLEDLGHRVKGLGPRSIEALKEWVTIDRRQETKGNLK